MQEPVAFSHRPGLGKLIVLARKAVYKLFLKWLLRPILEQQNGFNQAAARLIEDLVESQERTAREVRQLGARVEALERRLDGGPHRVKPRVVICATKIPFAYGGAEMLVDSLRDELKLRGFEVDIVALPFHWPTRTELMKVSLAWRLVNLTEAAGKRIDLVIATRFPSYLIKHPNKVVWLIHQLRQAYDLLGTTYSDFSETQPRDARALEMIRAMDRRTLSRGARRLHHLGQRRGPPAPLQRRRGRGALSAAEARPALSFRRLRRLHLLDRPARSAEALRPADPRHEAH